jgi:antitoxin component of MazEF toxin-antitoxin module
MLRKVFKKGNSVLVSLPKEALNYLGLSPGENINLELDRDKRQIVISPIKSSLEISGVDETFAQEINSFIEQYRPAL